MWPVWRIGQYSNFPPLISQHSYQITSQMMWHPLAPDKIFLQLKGFDKIAIDNREIQANSLTIHAIMHNGTQP